jgi:hypothetical protein
MNSFVVYVFFVPFVGTKRVSHEDHSEIMDSFVIYVFFVHFVGTRRVSHEDHSDLHKEH